MKTDNTTNPKEHSVKNIIQIQNKSELSDIINEKISNLIKKDLARTSSVC